MTSPSLEEEIRASYEGDSQNAKIFTKES